MALVTVPFAAQLLTVGDPDASLLVRYLLAPISLLAGVLIARVSEINKVLKGVLSGFGLLCLILLADIVSEAALCGPSLCADGRVAPGFGVPGLFQEYVYLPTLLVFLISLGMAKSRMYLPLVFIAGSYVVLSGSREGMLLLLTFLILGARARSRLIILISGMVGALYFMTGDTLGWADFEDLAIWRKFAGLEVELHAENSRVAIATDYFRLVKQSPWVGNLMLPTTNINSVLVLDQPSAHNGYVDALGSGGVFGLTALVVLLTASMAVLFQSRRRSALHRVVMVFFFLFALISMNINVPNRAPLIAVPVFFVCGLLSAAKRQREMSDCLRHERHKADLAQL